MRMSTFFTTLILGLNCILSTPSSLGTNGSKPAPCTKTWLNHCCHVDCSNRNLSEVQLPQNLPNSTCVLNLTFNFIKSFPETYFQKLPNLTILDLSHNQLGQEVGVAFSDLPRLKHLNISHNNVQSISLEAFSNLTSLVHLDMSCCGLRSIEPGSLSRLQNITTLNLTGNWQLGFDGLENATEGLGTSAITELYINNIVSRHKLCVVVLDRHLRNLENTSLKTIEADRNSIVSFGGQTLELLPKTLQNVTVRRNNFAFAQYVLSLSNLTGLTHIKLGGTVRDLSQIIPVADDLSTVEYYHCSHSESCAAEENMWSFPQETFEMPLRSNILTSNKTRPLHIPPNLTYVSYANAESSITLSEVHFGENKLEHLDLSFNVMVDWQGPIIGLNHLKVLNLAQNVASNVSYHFFEYLTSLEHLNLSGNSLDRCITCDKKGQIFGSLKNLEYLDLSKQFLHHLPYNIFQGLHNLKELDLSHNALPEIELNLTCNKKLQYIDFSYNQIWYIYKGLRHQLDMLAARPMMNISINLTGNPLLCKCAQIEFLKWLEISKVGILNFENYTCYNNEDRNIHMKNPYVLIENFRVSCSQEVGKLVWILFATCFVFSLICFSMIYRNRWKLRYLYYVAKLRVMKLPESRQSFDYDGFISYADENREFVLTVMMPKLEAEGIRLNVHHRDFLPGNPIAENIIDAIQKSRRAVIVLSKDFVRSKWCMYEVNMANMEGISTGRDVLVIVMYEDVPTRDVPPELLYHIQNNTYIEYPHIGSDTTFWEHLSQALRNEE
ncbi:toll-like receptor 4 [Haliotis rubra]|uniref:toll-like receptor 4 n=1 Tax=Haliotis rubra TaxID=36100 RepID=UPI001EE55868|nr:toll-like receptor 4 [Haliotis rubra]